MRTIPWEETLAKLPLDLQEEIRVEAEAQLMGLELRSIRKKRKLTQKELAERLGIRQANVSKLERRFDMRVSTLRDVIEAMGGELCITAKFPTAEYRIDLLEPPAKAREVA